MTATSDFVHDEDVVDAVIAALQANLPAAWLDVENSLYGVKRVEFGDLEHWDRPPQVTIEDLCPYILVFANRTDDSTRIYGGLGGKEGWSVPVRVVHLWTKAQCRDETTPATAIQAARAQCQRAKVISKAIFATRTLASPTLTTTDATARVVECKPVNISYKLPELAGTEVIGLAVDLIVHTQTQ